jgi:hypothetical protein
MERTGSWMRALFRPKIASPLRRACVAAVAVCMPLTAQARQNPPTPVPPGTPVTITVQPAPSAAPPVSITLAARHGHVTPYRSGCTHTGGGNIDVAQPNPNTVVVTMTGVAVAYGSPCQSGAATLNFDLEQCFEVNFDNPKLKKAKITIEGRVIGLLRSHCKGGQAGYKNASAAIGAGPAQIIALTVPPHEVVGGENLAVNDHDGPISVPIAAGKYILRQTFTVEAIAPKMILPCKAPSAEFAPDPALDPLWISYKEPFHGASKKDFGFQVTITVAEDESNGESKPEEKSETTEKLPEPKPINKPMSIRKQEPVIRID